MNSCGKIRVRLSRKAEFKTCAEELNADLSLSKTLKTHIWQVTVICISDILIFVLFRSFPVKIVLSYFSSILLKGL